MRSPDKNRESLSCFYPEAIYRRSVFSKKEVCRKIADFLSRKYPNDDFKLGVSSTAQLMEDITQLHEESVASLKIMNRNSNIVHFDSLGIEGVLFQAKNADTIEKIRL